MLLKVIRPILVAGFCVFTVTSAWAEPPKVKQTEEKAPIVFKDGEKGRTSFLQTIKYRQDNSRIGELQKGWLCSKSGNIILNKKLYDAFGSKFPAAFRAELEQAHYPVAGDKIFDVPKSDAKSTSSLHVGMLIKDVAANFCLKSDGTLGGVYMKVFWQVYSPEAQKILFETTTEGTFQPNDMVKMSWDKFFINAFRAAARNLLAEPGYHDAITNMNIEPASGGSAALNAEAGKPAALKLKKSTATGPLKDIITGLRSAVVTINGDGKSGTGFFVSKDGHLLTNQHVVGSAKFVKVKLATGREMLGEVLLSDKTRDVALVKTEPISVHPIMIRGTEPNIGEEVYVLGSPLGDTFNTTLTRGILSGYRTLNEKRYLQSDVAILPGNSGGPLMDEKGSVIGITVAGLGSKGLAGMNFFIPINDALTKLNIELE
jgi:serine protease Do